MGHKYVGLDVHQSSTVAAVHDEEGKSVMESILATEAEAIRDFLKGLWGHRQLPTEKGQAVEENTPRQMPWVKFVLDMPFHRTPHAADLPPKAAGGG